MNDQIAGVLAEIDTDNAIGTVALVESMVCAIERAVAAGHALTQSRDTMATLLDPVNAWRLKILVGDEGYLSLCRILTRRQSVRTNLAEREATEAARLNRIAEAQQGSLTQPPIVTQQLPSITQMIQEQEARDQAMLAEQLRNYQARTQMAQSEFDRTRWGADAMRRDIQLQQEISDLLTAKIAAETDRLALEGTNGA